VAEDPKSHELGNTQSHDHEQTCHIHTLALKIVECQWQDEYGVTIHISGVMAQSSALGS